MSTINFDWDRVKNTIYSQAKYLIDTQCEDGGWGDKKEANLSSPQNTGEALTALLIKGDLTGKELQSVLEGIKFLIDKQLSDGGWSRAKQYYVNNPKGQTIATCWAIHALFRSLNTINNCSSDFQEDNEKMALTGLIIESIKKANQFLISLSSNRRVDGSWSEYQELESSVTATCCAILTLLESKNHSQTQEMTIQSVINQGWSWLTNSVNPDGGIGFLKNDPSRCSTTLLFIITGNNFLDNGLLPQKVVRASQWIQAKLESNDSQRELCSPNVEFEANKSVIRDYQHFTLARLVYYLHEENLEKLLIEDDSEDVNKSNVLNTWRQQYLSKLLELQRDNYGCQVQIEDPVYTWSTAQALIALTTAYSLHLRKSSSAGGENLKTDSSKREESNSISIIVNSDKVITSILHISDLHFTVGMIENRRLADIWFNQLDQDLRRNLNQKVIDILIISGDIANASKPEEYAEAEKFIKKICDSFSIKPKQCVIVPGNHDLDWSISKNAFSFSYREDCQGKVRPNIDIEEGNFVLIRSEASYIQRFEHFRRFHENVTQFNYPESYDDQGILYYFPSSQLLILGLNSAWHLDHHYKGKERSGIKSEVLAKILPVIRQNPDYTDCLKIAIWHHPVTGPEMMNDEFMELLANDGFQVCLHGHIHQSIEGFYKYDNKYRLHIIGAGTFGAPAKQQVVGIPLQYNLLILDPAREEITVHTRKKEKIDGSWSADARWGDKNSPLPSYTISYTSSQLPASPNVGLRNNRSNTSQGILNNNTIGGNLIVERIIQISHDPNQEQDNMED